MPSIVPHLRICQILLALLFLCCGCTVFRVDPPPTPSVSLDVPRIGQAFDIAIEARDLIDRNLPIARVGDTFWGGQYQVVLNDSMKNYLEATAAHDLMAANFTVCRYPGDFALKRLALPKPPLHFQLELQTLSLSRHSKEKYLADRVIGICKIRAILLDVKGKIVYQRQFVGNVDTYRPSDDLIPPGVGLFSRAGLSGMLEGLLRKTMDEFRDQGIPEIRTVFDEYRAKGGKTTDAEGTETPEENEEQDDDDATNSF